ncbi:DarT ssDNA thymidine ADP-ribosyltransferase family protein [Parabacteroides sp. OttesenSCG-928-J18]|nr:DarT ssDNA thymidine ADP-ribosyltransferase family protein [Parabacteroides sp. OttesenSCG-928-J18]
MSFFQDIIKSIFGKPKDTLSDSKKNPISDVVPIAAGTEEVQREVEEDGKERERLELLKTKRAKRRQELKEDLALIEKKLEIIRSEIASIIIERKNISESQFLDSKIIVEPTVEKSKKIFQSNIFDSIPSMADCQRQRIEEEKRKIEKAEKIATDTIASVLMAIKQRNLSEAKEGLNLISQQAAYVENQGIRNSIKEVVLEITELSNLLEAEKRENEEAQRKKEAKGAQQRVEDLEQERQTSEARRLLEKVEKEERAKRYQIELLAKEEAQRKEQKRLNSLSDVLKSDAQEIVKYLRDNCINFFYHFTDEKNISLIRQRKGLYSWSYLLSHDLTIPSPGGNVASRGLDRDKGIEDYVRLSLCKSNPITYRIYQESKGTARLVLLKIKIDVAMFEHTKFSDTNATDKRAKVGDDKDFIEKYFDFDAISLERCRNTGPQYKKRQAEVMVKTFIPAKYILNLDNPELITFNN